PDSAAPLTPSDRRVSIRSADWCEACRPNHKFGGGGVPVSVDLIVYLRRSAMPSPSGWQQAIAATGLPVELDADFDPDTFSGFLPCKLRGTVSGFEYFAGPISPTEASELGAPPGSDFSVTLVTHSDLRQFACSAVAAGALARESGGL